MKILDEDEKKGEFTLKVENLDDLWHLYNILAPNDEIKGRTLRRMKRESNDQKKSDSGERVPVILTIRVEKFQFHPFTNRLRVTGVIIDGPEDVTLWSHHTFNIEVNSEFSITKKKWESFNLKRLQDAVKSSEKPKILVLVVDKGEAILGKITDIGVQVLASIKKNIPGKRFDVKYLGKAMEDFFNSLKLLISEHVSEDSNDAIIIAGPGLINEKFAEWLIKSMPNLKNKIILETAHSADKSGIYEVIKKGVTSKKIEEFRLNKEASFINELLKRIGKDDQKVAFGLKEVEKAIEYGAVETLLIADKFIREGTIEDRQKIDKLLRNVERNRGKIIIISTLHEAGEQLLKLGSIAGLLRFAI
ncbi:MAG: mRNA surveillance protein pelota [Candidatus Helarchaeota archaeon]